MLGDIIDATFTKSTLPQKEVPDSELHSPGIMEEVLNLEKTLLLYYVPSADDL